MKTGMCSISFRKLGLAEVTELVRRAGLDAIEWGGDVHVPPGNLSAAQRALRLTRDAGLQVSSYGSYYSPLDDAGIPQDFTPVLESALALETSAIRIWAGRRPSDEADEAYRNTLVETVRDAVEQAAPHRVRLAFEFHRGTLTDTNESTAALLQAVDHPGCRTYWQPPYLDPVEYRLAGLQLLREQVLNLHVFHWVVNPAAPSPTEGIERRPLQEGAEEWGRYLAVPLRPDEEHFALLEFARDDDPDQLVRDAAVLKSWAGG